MLEEYMARAWARHINALDGPLTLEARIDCLNPREVVNTFVGFLRSNLKTIRPSEIHERTMHELMGYSDPPDCMRELLLQTYAECILPILNNVKHDRCMGCKYEPCKCCNFAHSCLEPIDDLLISHFHECLENVDEETLLEKYTEKLHDSDFSWSANELRHLVICKLELLPGFRLSDYPGW